MSEVSFENFGHETKKAGYGNIFISSSRYKFQEKFIPILINDIKNKLRVSHKDTLLDIGCGLGLFLIPLSFFCNTIVGIDHKNFINQIISQFRFIKKKNLISGNFLKIKLKRKFDKILIYSEVHYLSSEEEFQKFIHKAISLLKHKGILLIGDIPIKEYEKAFIKSDEGKKYYQKVEKIKKAHKKKNKAFGISNFLKNRKKDSKLVIIDLEMIQNLKKRLDSKKLKVKFLRHKKSTMFNNTRIDIIIERK